MGLKVFLDEDCADNAKSFLQSRFWAGFKAGYGWKPLILQVESGSPELSSDAGASGRCQLLALVRRLPGGLCFAYLPHGPELEIPEGERTAFLAELSEAMRPLLPARCLFIRFDPPWYRVSPSALGEAAEGEAVGDKAGPSAVSLNAEALRPSLGSPLRRSAADVQPPDTVLVDLGPSEADILAAMKSKWRYNIRLAEKKGVEVEAGGLDKIPEFYRLYRATSERDKIALHPEAYYARLFSLAAEGRSSGAKGLPDIRLWIARHEGVALAAIITLFRGDRAVYLYGASSDEKRNLMPAYALQWAAMRAAKASGCREYDLFGIPPTDDPEHPMYGLYRFKTGFGGRVVHRAGSWDYPLSGIAYTCFRAAESMRTWWYKDFKKRLRRSENEKIQERKS
jgi:lipid II:glycine glycyltransferase (peptidoglycan interpeptide bridge formation enzyme)